jgi:F0F1-type ATP synthase membrane subunit b/b'
MKRPLVCAVLLLIVSAMLSLPAAVPAETGEHSPSQATAAESEAHGGGHVATPWYRGMDLWKGINLAVLLFVIYKLMAVPIKRILSDRSHTIEEMLRGAENDRALAGEELLDMRQKLTGAKTEIEEILSRGQDEARKVIEQIKAATVVDMASMQKRAGEELSQELIDARQALIGFLASKAVQRAEQKIRTMDMSKLQAKYLRQFQQSLTIQGGNGERS